jgi:adenylate cyclase class 2
MKLCELEIKIQIGSKKQFETVFDACQALYGAPTSHVLQLDQYYDTSDRQLKKQDLVVRIRSSNNTRTIALKSPRVDLPSGMSKRIELEFVAADGKDVEEQLKEQGLDAHEASEKERWTFVYNDCEIVLDRLPFIGYFVEIEGPSETAIQTVVRALNLSESTVIQKNYGELMIEKFITLSLPTSSIKATFEEEKRFQ